MGWGGIIYTRTRACVYRHRFDLRGGSIYENERKTMPNLLPIPSYGELMTVTEFFESRENGWLILSDGSGYYATADGFDRASSVWEVEQPDWATHVMWFNK